MVDALAAVTAVITLATVSISLVVALRSRKRVNEIHVLVNDRLTGVLERVDQLSRKLQDAGIDIPPNRHEEP